MSSSLIRLHVGKNLMRFDRLLFQMELRVLAKGILVHPIFIRFRSSLLQGLPMDGTETDVLPQLKRV